MSKSKKENMENEKRDDACIKELQEWKDKFIRVSSDLENFRRRIDKEKLQWMKIAQAQIVKDLLNILDDFDRAIEQKKNQKISVEIEKLFLGFEMIGGALNKVLKGYDLKEITKQKEFDPNIHEAIAQLDSDDHESGDIIEIIQKGYRFKNQVIRPSKVTVAK